jgi:survival-of-motor-neuron-related-splicing factor 30
VAQFQVGAKVLARYAADGQWYEARVERVPQFAGDKYAIAFVGYGDQAEVGSDEIRPPSATGATAGAAVGTTGKKHKRDEVDDNTPTITDSSGKKIPIPKSLQILPTDTEEEKRSKRRKIHAIKAQHRTRNLEEERNKSQSSWQSFLHTSSKSTKAPLQKQSIFRSPDTVEGKVGVTRSGAGLTKQSTFNATDIKLLGKRAHDDDDDDDDDGADVAEVDANSDAE